MLKWPAKRFRRKITRGFALTLATLLLLVCVYIVRLGSLTPGLSPAESSARTGSSSIHLIAHQPANAPHKALQYGLQKLGYQGALPMRLVSALLAIILIGCFYKVSSRWFGKAVGWFSTVIFATTPLVILAGRSATPTILLLTPVAIICLYTWLTRDAKRLKIKFLIFLAAVSLSLYVPGMIWLLALGAIFGRRSLAALRSAISVPILLLSMLVPIGVLAPLGFEVFKHPAILKSLALVPAHWLGIIAILKSIGWAAGGLVYRTSAHSDLIIGRLALLDIAQLILIVFGAYAMWHRARDKFYSLSALVLLAILLSGLNQNLYLLLFALPPLGILIAAGLRYLYIEWKGVFPSNPIPRGLAIVLMLVIVSIQVVYGVRYSLVAWPHSVATHSLYVLK